MTFNCFSHFLVCDGGDARDAHFSTLNIREKKTDVVIGTLIMVLDARQSSSPSSRASHSNPDPMSDCHRVFAIPHTVLEGRSRPFGGLSGRLEALPEVAWSCLCHPLVVLRVFWEIVATFCLCFFGLTIQQQGEAR